MLPGAARYDFVEVLDRDRWLELCRATTSSSLHSSWTWGEYKARGGWAIRRVAVHAQDSGALVACFQAQVKQRAGMRAIWLQGGLHTATPSDDASVAILADVRDRYFKLGTFDVMLVNHGSGVAAEHAELGLLRAGFTPTLNSRMYTYALDLTRGLPELEKSLSGNWRHNLRRATRSDRLTVRWIQDATERRRAVDRLAVMYRQLMDRKTFTAAMDVAMMSDLLAADGQCEIAEAVLGDEVIAVRVGYACRDHMVDLLAASTDKARNTYANYLLMWEMIRRAVALGLRVFDCGGIDPAGNEGVFNFKKGLGARAVSLGPLWLFNRHRWIRAGVRLALSSTW